MSLTIYSQSYSEVVSVDEAKVHIKQDDDITDDDDLISAQIMASRDTIETATGSCNDRSRVMLATTYEWKMDWFPSYCLKLPRVPVISVDSITYVDTAGVTQTLSASTYVVDYGCSEIDLAYNMYWPSTQYQPGAVTIRFTAGQAATITAAQSTDVLTVYGRTFTNGDRVQLINSGGSLPGGLTQRVTYYVVSASGSTFKLSLTAGGSAIDVTSIGSGIHYATFDPIGFTAMRQAVLLQLAKHYKGRGDLGFQNSGSWDATQRAIDSLTLSQSA